MSKDINDSEKLLIKKCHVCGHLNESHTELRAMPKVSKIISSQFLLFKST